MSLTEQKAVQPLVHTYPSLREQRGLMEIDVLFFGKLGSYIMLCCTCMWPVQVILIFVASFPHHSNGIQSWHFYVLLSQQHSGNIVPITQPKAMRRILFHILNPDFTVKQSGKKKKIYIYFYKPKECAFSHDSINYTCF